MILGLIPQLERNLSYVLSNPSDPGAHMVRVGEYRLWFNASRAKNYKELIRGLLSEWIESRLKFGEQVTFSILTTTFGGDQYLAAKFVGYGDFVGLWVLYGELATTNITKEHGVEKRRSIPSSLAIISRETAKARLGDSVAAPFI